MYFPKEVWRTIFEFDPTYKEKYDKVIEELEYIYNLIKTFLDLIELFQDNDYEDIDWGI